MSDLADTLDTAATVVAATGTLLGPPGAAAAQIAALALRAGAAFARAGKDPVAEIARLHAVDPLLAQVRADWDAELGKLPEKA
jgi:hypothetical protein